MASPERMARAAEARSPGRSTMPRLGDAASCSTNMREVSDRSASTTTTPSSRMTGWLNTAVRTAKANNGTRKIKMRAARSCSSQRHSRLRRARSPPSAPASSALLPFHIRAHAGPQLRHLLDRIGADGECPQVEIAGGAGGAPARVFALGGDEPDLDGDAAVTQCWNSHVEAVADLEILDQVLTQIEVHPQVVEV